MRRGNGVGSQRFVDRIGAGRGHLRGSGTSGYHSVAEIWGAFLRKSDTVLVPVIHIARRSDFCRNEQEHPVDCGSTTTTSDGRISG